MVPGVHHPYLRLSVHPPLEELLLVTVCYLAARDYMPPHLAGGDPLDHLGQRRGGARAVLARVHGGVVSQAVRRAEVGLGHTALGLKLYISVLINHGEGPY